MSFIMEYHIYHFIDLSIFVRSSIDIIDWNRAGELTSIQLVFIDKI